MTPLFSSQTCLTLKFTQSLLVRSLSAHVICFLLLCSFFMFSLFFLACSVGRRATLYIPCSPDVDLYVFPKLGGACRSLPPDRAVAIVIGSALRAFSSSTKTPKATSPLPPLLVARRVQGRGSHRKTNPTNGRNAPVLVIFISKSFKRTARKHVRQLYVQRWPPTPNTCSPLSNLSSPYTFGIFCIPSAPPPPDTSRRPNEIP